MKKVLKKFGSLLGAEASGLFLSLIVGFALTVLISSAKVVSAITTVIFASMVYSAGWNEGRRDSRKVGESFPDFKSAVKAALMCGGITLVLLLVRIAVYHIKPTSWAPVGEGYEMVVVKSGALAACDIIYRLWNYYFIGFMLDSTLLSYFLPVLFPVLIYPAAYKVGLKRFSVIERYLPQLVYKPKKNKR